MTTSFVSDGLWPTLTREIRRARARCDVAVAYFGRGADELVPLRAGSRLVVDASEAAVGSGQTYPPGLLRLVRRGVRVFSAPLLHAKVFVVGNTVFAGSSNASRRSGSLLIEAAVSTTHRRAVATARRFVRQQCLVELTPGRLRQLAKLWKPPRVPTVGVVRRAASRRLFLVQLEPTDLSEAEKAIARREMKVAKRQRHNTGPGFCIDEFWYRAPTFKTGDVVVQVLDERPGRVLMSPPGQVIHVKPPSRGAPDSYVCVERPARRRRHVRAVARPLGQTQKSLQRDRRIRDRRLADALLRLWS